MLNPNEVFEDVLNTFRALFNNSVWTRCKERESSSGHDYLPGPLLMKQDGKTMSSMAICQFCGGTIEIVQTEVMSSFPSHRMNEVEPKFN